MSDFGYCSLKKNKKITRQLRRGKYGNMTGSHGPEINGIVLFCEESIEGRNRYIEVSAKKMLTTYSVLPVRSGEEKKPVKCSKEDLVEVGETFKL